MNNADRSISDSLLDAIDAPAMASSAGHHRLAHLLCAARQRLGTRCRTAWNTPRWRHAIMALSSIGALGLGLGLYLAFRPIPTPDYAKDDLSTLFDYTLLTNEFNNLPVQERLDLVAQLYNRVKDMDASESVLMASFFAGVSGEARQQLQRNAGKLLVDATDMIAKDYTRVPPSEKEAYLDDAYIRLVRLTEPFDSSIASKSDEELLERGRRDAAQGREQMQKGDISAKQASRMLTFMNKQVNNSATVRQQQRLTLFMRDLSRHMRGESINP